MDIRIFLILPAFGIMLLAFGSQLAEVAESSAGKTLDFATDMENAVGCAAHGIPLEECSPGIMGYDFTPEINETTNLTNTFLSDYLAQLEEFEETNYIYEINETGNTTIIIIRPA